MLYNRCILAARHFRAAIVQLNRLARSQASAYLTACNDCPDEKECEECAVTNADTVQKCETLLAHVSSPNSDGTLESLNLARGYWRSSSTSKDILECYEEDACVGGVDGYCELGYGGPCKCVYVQM